VLQPSSVRLPMPLAGNLAGNQNHLGSMYAGALFSLAQIPGGALFMTRFDVTRFYPLGKDMQLHLRRPASVHICVEAHTLAKGTTCWGSNSLTPVAKW
jgi:acyl-coenzyme A thioesterase PaaI-like protein